MEFASGLAVGVWFATAVCAWFAYRAYQLHREVIESRDAEYAALESALQKERDARAELSKRLEARPPEKKSTGDKSGVETDAMLTESLTRFQKTHPNLAKRYGYA